MFGKLEKHVRRNKHLSMNTEVRVHDTCILSILLYGSACWTTYHHQKNRLRAFHTRSLQAILGDTWKDKITNEWLFQITNSRPLSSKLKLIWLTWLGHVQRIPKDGLPRCIFHSLLQEGTRPVRDFNTESSTWTSVALNWGIWRDRLHKGIRCAINTNLEKVKQTETSL